MATRRSTPARETKMTSRKTESQADAGAKPAGMGMSEAVLIISALLLIGAIVFVEKHLAEHLGGGVLMK